MTETKRERSFKDVTIPGGLFDRWIYLSSCAKVLLIVLHYFKDETGAATRTEATIEEHSGLTRPQVAASLRELQSFGWILRQKGSPADTFSLRIPDAQTD